MAQPDPPASASDPSPSASPEVPEPSAFLPPESDGAEPDNTNHIPNPSPTAEPGPSPLEPSRSFSIASLAPTLIGIAMLIAYFKFGPLFFEGRQAIQRLFFAVAVVLTLWGLSQVVITLSGAEVEPKQKNRHRMLIPRPGGIYLLIMIAMFLGSLLGNNNMLMLLFSMMAGPFILNGWLSFSMLKGCEVIRRVPDRAMVGEVLSIGLTLANRKRVISSWLMTVRDWIRSPTETLESGVMFARIPPRGERSSRYQLCPMRRGRYKFGPVEIITRYPFGLVERRFVVPQSDSLLVYPRLGRLTGRWKAKQMQLAELLDRSQNQRGAYDDEFHRIREYRTGDNPRAIHWRSSARQRELMVREYEQARDQHLAILVDLYVPPKPTVDDLERVELALSFAATIAVERIRENRADHLNFTVIGETTRHWGQGDDDEAVSIESLFDLLAMIQPAQTTGLRDTLDAVRQSCPSQTRFVVISTLDQPDDSIEDTAGAGHRTAIGRAQVQSIHATWQELSPFFVLD